MENDEHEHGANVTVHYREARWCFRCEQNSAVDLCHKLRAKAGPLRFISGSGGIEFAPSVTTIDDREGHFLRRADASALILS